MKIGLLDHMGYGNLGDAATQDVVISNIKKRLPSARLFGFSLIPEDTVKRHGIPCYPIRWCYPTPEKTGSQAVGRVSLKSRLKRTIKSNRLVYTWAKPVSDFARKAVFWVRSYRTLRSLDLLIISGGGQIDELWHGPWLQPYTLFKFALLTKLARKKLYLLNVGAGPLQHPLSQFFARWAVRFADYRSFRDRDSQERIRKLGVRATTQVYPDAVYALDVDEALKSGAPGHSRLVVGINPTGFCDPRIWPRKIDAIYLEYIEKLVQFSSWLLERGFVVRLFSTDLENDRLAIEDMKAGLVAKSSSPEAATEVFLNASGTVKDVLREMSAFDFVLTSKYHGIIFSHLLGKPVISLSYQRKMDVAMESVGQGRFGTGIENFTFDWLKSAFCSLVDESGSIKSGSAAAVEANATALSQQFDGLFLPDKS